MKSGHPTVVTHLSLITWSYSPKARVPVVNAKIGFSVAEWTWQLKVALWPHLPPSHRGEGHKKFLCGL